MVNYINLLSIAHNPHREDPQALIDRFKRSLPNSYQLDEKAELDKASFNSFQTALSKSKGINVK